MTTKKFLARAHRHRNPDGSEGGWVADSATVALTATIGNGVTIGNDVSVGNGVTIGSCTTIGSRVFIGNGVSDWRAGSLLAYGWAFWPREGVVVLSFGCVTLSLEEWRESLPRLCKRHEPGRADQYQRAISHLLDYAEAEVATKMDGEDD